MNSKKLLRKTSAGLSQMTHTFYKDTVLSGRKSESVFPVGGHQFVDRLDVTFSLSICFGNVGSSCCSLIPVPIPSSERIVSKIHYRPRYPVG